MTIPPERLTKQEFVDIATDAMALKRRIDEEWAAGKRDGMRLGIFSAADALKNLVAAFDEGDVGAFRLALGDLGSARMSLTFHAAAWRREMDAKKAGEREGR